MRGIIQSGLVFLVVVDPLDGRPGGGGRAADGGECFLDAGGVAAGVEGLGHLVEVAAGPAEFSAGGKQLGEDVVVGGDGCGGAGLVAGGGQG
ncbi:hypothetical protein RB201_35990 [Streptomyces sp. S1A(2023)]